MQTHGSTYVGKSPTMRVKSVGQATEQSPYYRTAATAVAFAARWWWLVCVCTRMGCVVGCVVGVHAVARPIWLIGSARVRSKMVYRSGVCGWIQIWCWLHQRFCTDAMQNWF